MSSYVIKKVFIGNISEYGLPVEESPVGYVSVRVVRYFSKKRFRTTFVFDFTLR